MNDERPTVTTHGEAVVSTRPDEGIWTVDVSVVEDTAQAALQDVARRSGELDRLLDELPIPQDKRSTSGVLVREELEYDNEGNQVHRGFRATNVLTLRLADPAVAGTLIEEAIERANAGVRGPVWWVAPDNAARLDACARAAQDARRRAEAYAEGLGLRLGAVTEVREASSPGLSLARSGAVALAAAERSPIDVDPGEIQVAATVDVTFVLES